MEKNLEGGWAFRYRDLYGGGFLLDLICRAQANKKPKVDTRSSDRPKSVEITKRSPIRVDF